MRGEFEKLRNCKQCDINKLSIFYKKELEFNDGVYTQFVIFTYAIIKIKKWRTMKFDNLWNCFDTIPRKCLEKTFIILIAKLRIAQ